MARQKNPFKLDVVSVRLVKDAPIYSKRSIENPLDAVELVGEQLKDMDREVICVINTKANGVPINCSFVSMGALEHALACPREMLKTSILSNAASIVLVHNHPSGEIKPSQADTRITDTMLTVCKYMEIPLLDHIIVAPGRNDYFSFREKRKLKFPILDLESNYKRLDFGRELVAEEGKVR